MEFRAGTRRALSTTMAIGVVVLFIIAGVSVLYESRVGSTHPEGSSSSDSSQSSSATASSTTSTPTTSSTTSHSVSTSSSNSTTSSSSSSGSSTTSSTTSLNSSTSSTSDSSTSSTTSTTLTSSTSTLPTPSPGAKLANITYCTVNGVQLQLDLYYPPSSFSPPYPLLVFVHGGGWVSGDKSGVTGTVLYNMTSDGFVVGSVNYRLAPTYPFPAQIEDVKCSIRFLKVNSGPLEIDPTRIGVMGTSAGGQLVGLLGVTGSDTIWDVGQWKTVSSAVNAVVIISGPENVTAPVTDSTWVDAVKADFNDSYTLEYEGSPVYHSAVGAPPFLLEYGYNDTIVPYSQGVEFNDTLHVGGAKCVLILVDNAGHVLYPISSTYPENPSLNVTRQDIVDFFVGLLKPAPAAPAALPGSTADGPMAVSLVAVAMLGKANVTRAQRREADA